MGSRQKIVETGIKTLKRLEIHLQTLFLCSYIYQWQHSQSDFETMLIQHKKNVQVFMKCSIAMIFYWEYKSFLKKKTFAEPHQKWNWQSWWGIYNVVTIFGNALAIMFLKTGKHCETVNVYKDFVKITVVCNKLKDEICLTS